MQSRHQIRLRTIFLITLCVAVGLTCATGDSVRTISSVLLGNREIKLDLFYGLLATATMTIIVGLPQQAVFLWRARREPQAIEPQFRTALYFSIAWRLVLSAAMFLLLLFEILFSRGLLKLPTHEDYYANGSNFPDTLLYLAMIVALFDSIRRWRPQPAARRSPTRTALGLAVAFVFILVALPNITFIHYLVHLATEGIESYQRLRRPNVFPSHESEHFRTFWRSAGALAIMAITFAGLLMLRNVRVNARRTLLLGTVFGSVVAGIAIYCRWFYLVEYPRISPDFASVGFASNRLDFAAVACVVLLVTTVIAYRLSTTSATTTIHSVTLSNPEMIALHQTVPSLILMMAAPGAYVFGWLRLIFDRAFPWTRLWEYTMYAICSPDSYIMLACAMLSVQFAWLRWRRRHDDIAWQITELNAPRLVGNWVALLLWIVVAIPVATIYAFAFWLGPWYKFGQ